MDAIDFSDQELFRAYATAEFYRLVLWVNYPELMKRLRDEFVISNFLVSSEN